jgi:hypothetical protein
MALWNMKNGGGKIMAKKKSRRGRKIGSRKSGSRTTTIALQGDRRIKIYAGARVSEALATVTNAMTVYEGVRLAQLIEAAYDQGLKDGARTVFDAQRKAQSQLEKSIPHRTPGRPRKTRS